MLSEYEQQFSRAKAARQRLMGEMPVTPIAEVIARKPDPIPEPEPDEIDEAEALRSKIDALQQEVDWLREGEPILIGDCMREVGQHYGVSRTDLVSNRRHRRIVRPRQIAMYLARILTDKSTPEIGRRLGNRDHATVLWGVRQVTKFMETDAQLREEIEAMAQRLKDKANAGGTGA